jgi:hypothetical protein
MHSKQGFKFELDYSLVLMKYIKEGNINKDKLKDVTGAGENKITTFYDWLKYIGAIDGSLSEIKLTKLGEAYLKIQENDDFLDPLVLYHLLKNPDLQEKDGHFYFATLMNEIFYNIVFDYENKKSLETIKKEMIKLGADEKYPNFIMGSLNSLIDSQSGFGKMGIIEKSDSNSKGDIYEAHSYWVEPLVGAYILYDMWEDNRASMGIDNIAHDKYNLGRMFLMDKEAVEEILEEIKALGLITVEKGSGLNQIKINRKHTKEDILEMMIKEA